MSQNHADKDLMGLRVAVVDDHDGLRGSVRQALNHSGDRLRADFGLDGVHDDVIEKKACRLLRIRSSEGLKHEPGLADARQPDHAQDLPGRRYYLSEAVAQTGQARIFHPWGLIVLGGASPVAPGVEGAGCSVRLFLHPRGDRRMAIYPRGDLFSVPKVDLLVFNVHAGIVERLANAGFSFIDLLPIVGVRAKHDVVAANLKGGEYHVLDFALIGQDVLGCRGRQYFAGLQLELVEPGRKEGRALRAAHPCDDPVLPSICGMDIARHLDAVSREVVGLGFGAQQPPQEQGQVPFPQN